MAFRGFFGGFAARLALLLAATVALAVACVTPGLAAARLLAVLAAAGAAWQLWRHIGRTNREVARFVEALRYGDFAQGFSRASGGGFDRLGSALDDAMRQLRAERAAASVESRLQAALLDEAPAALLMIDREARVTLANKAARRLFDRLAGTRTADFREYGAELVAWLDGDQPGRQVIRMRVGEAAQRAIVSRATIDRLGAVRLVAVQPIQQELSALELATQADLVRVLTHEIMNSITPVVSLADSADKLVSAMPDADPEMAEVRLAIDTLARRARGILRFVAAYRQFSTMPVAHRRAFAAAPWAAEVRRLFAAAHPEATLAVRIAPPGLMLDADPDLLAQAVLNLLNNGAEAAAQHGSPPCLVLEARSAPRGRGFLAIQDNGPGVPPELAGDVFLPFFTTKATGTGVGLSLTRRILTAHDGTIELVAMPGQGARFELVV